MISNSFIIIGTESLGVRGLCCVVKTESKKILIDPGIALGYTRKGLLPHPVQVAVDEIIQKQIINHLSSATDIVFSHFHGDHVPLGDANPYQLKLSKVKDMLKGVNIWAKGIDGDSYKMRERAWNLKFYSKNYSIAEGKKFDEMVFSKTVPHGEEGSHLGNVMITKIIMGEKNIVHASDIQFLSHSAIEEIIKLKADIVIASGPPLYLPYITKEVREEARRNILDLSSVVELLIIDHHLLRCEEGLEWLRKLDRETNNRILCAADVMGISPQLLEARRSELYRKIPVEKDWHEKYADGKVNMDSYLLEARQVIEGFAY
jgi:uncharacterized protein